MEGIATGLRNHRRHDGCKNDCDRHGFEKHAGNDAAHPGRLRADAGGGSAHRFNQDRRRGPHVAPRLKRITMNPELPTEPDETATRTRVPLALEDVLAAVCMGVLALITFANVVLRYLTDESIAWTEEISISMMVIMTLAAAAAAVARERHIRIDYFLERGSPRRRRALSLIATGTVVLFFIAMTVLSSRVVWDEFRFEETSPGIGVPTWWYTIWLPLLSAAIALRGIGLFVRHWKEH